MATTVKSQKLVDEERLDITKYKEFTPHPAMKLIPHMREDEFEKLKEDIKQNGVKIRILFTGTQLLDGLHRYVAWKELKMEGRVPRSRYHGNDPYGEVLSRNIMRRHLSDDQRAFIIAEARREALELEAKKRQLSGLRKGDEIPVVSFSTIQNHSNSVSSISTQRGRTHEQLAEAADVTPHKARQAIDVSKFGTPTEKADVSAGTARLKDIARKARSRAAKAGKRKAKPTKEVDKTSKEYVKKKFHEFLNRIWSVAQLGVVKPIIHRLLTADKP